MINLIFKEEFYNNINTTKVTTIKIVLRLPDNIKTLIDDYFHLDKVYLRIDNYYVVYINTLSYLLVPEVYDVNEVVTQIRYYNSVISFDNWKLIKTGEDKTMMLNSFMRVYSKCKILNRAETASWKLVDLVSNNVIEFETLAKPNTCTWWCDEDECLISYPEKNKFPYKENELIEKDKLLEIIINGCKNNQGFSI